VILVWAKDSKNTVLEVIKSRSYLIHSGCEAIVAIEIIKRSNITLSATYNSPSNHLE
jgi:hypothetical protein